LITFASVLLNWL